MNCRLRKLQNKSPGEILERSFVKLYYRIGYLRTLLTSFVEVPQDAVWVFIVGCYNSGTTLLNEILGQHPEIAILPDEGVWLTNILSKPEDYSWGRLWCGCKDQIYLDENSTGVNVDRLKAEWCFWYGKDKKVFLEKSIANSARTRFLQKNFENAHFIWIIRNGYAVAEGIRRKAYGKKTLPLQYKKSGYPIELCAWQWVENNRVIEEDSEHIRNIKQIFYEDLVSDPEAIVEDILNFLPVEDKSSPSLNRVWKILGVESPIKNMNQKNIEQLSLRDIQAINEVAEPMLRRYGYFQETSQKDL